MFIVLNCQTVLVVNLGQPNHFYCTGRIRDSPQQYVLYKLLDMCAYQASTEIVVVVASFVLGVVCMYLIRK